MGERPLTYRDYAAFARMSAEQIARDCEVQAFHASGPGGQGVNTADSAVRMRHVPTGIVVVSREERSQLRNRERCVEKILETCRRRARPPRPRKKTRVPVGQRRRRLEDKRARGKVKQLRRRVEGE
ncbi:peptide chain release factor-like protein [Olsenella profusa]|uniref:Peptide chain release factor-like protein n=1 Tax=Olsenella profusa TaxID=138595 RepID=A0ABS2F208_9ACTN|nr:peptide chain release factor-like protein [Olsenella profusa]MBM6774842.1 peptide chain release factor-like protein [Olsenella profusa]